PPPSHPPPACVARRRPPPASPLFPYTTLFRSSRTARQRLWRSCSAARLGSSESLCSPEDHAADLPPARSMLSAAARRNESVYWRSEEHTSELQSLRHLVCRLLLEKKKNKTQS